MKKRNLIIILTVTEVVVVIIVFSVLLHFFQGVSGINNSSKTNEDISNNNFISFDEGFTDIVVKDSTSALKVINSVKDNLGLKDTKKELKLSAANKFIGNSVYRFRQYYKDIPVFGKDVILSANKIGKVISLTSNTTEIADKLQTNSTKYNKLKSKKALDNYFESVSSVSEEGQYIYCKDNNCCYAHKYTVLGVKDKNSVNMEVLVSDNDYKVVYTDDLVNTNSSDYTYKVSDNEYFMYDKKRNLLMLDSNKASANILYNNNKTKSLILDDDALDELTIDWLSEYEQSLVFDNYIKNTKPNTSSISDMFNLKLYGPIKYVSSEKAQWNKNAVGFMKGVEKTYDFYKRFLSRKSFDNKNGEMYISYNDKQGKYDGDNAFSDDKFLCFGYKKSSNTIDLVAHEFTHSVEGTISSMKYQGESGALMEAYSDIFGEFAEDFKNDNKLNNNCDWHHTGSRNLENPSGGNLFEKKYPSEYKGKNWLSTDSETDNGHVHNNSTVISHAAYLMNIGLDNSDESYKIDTYTLSKIWYKSLFLLHKNSTFKQCADAVYNAANMTEGLTFNQKVCVRGAFEMVGLSVKSDISYSVSNGTKIYAITKNNQKYNNYHIKIINQKTKKTVVNKDITNTNGYKLKLKAGEYILSISDNRKNGSKNKYNKYIKVYNSQEPSEENYLNILTDFSYSNDTLLKEKINKLINKYGKASTEQCQTIYTNSDKYGWTHRKGILSAKLIDLDNNGQNKLVTVRLLEYNKSKNKGELVIETFYADNGVVRSAGSYKLENTNDSENAQINIYTYKIKDKNYLCYERQFYGKWVVDYNRPEYYIFEYKNNNLSKKMRLYNALEGTSGYDYRQSIWTNGKENNIVLQANYSDFKSNGEEYLVHKGKYIKSKYPFNDAMKDFGFTSSSERLLDIDSGYITDFFSYANQTPAKKICTISTREIQSNDIITAQSSAFDYTGLNPSKTEKKTITAEDLFKKPVTEIVKLMENEFTVKKAEIETIYYFYNYNKFPGMDFYFRKDYEDKTSAEKLVKSGSISLEGIEVNGNGIGCYKNDKQVKANYDFKKCSEIYGKIDCLPSNGGMVGGTLEAIEYKENKGNYIIRISFELTSNTRNLVYGSTDYKKIPYKTIIKDNPKVRNIVVQKNYY